MVEKEKKLPPIRDRALAYLARREHTPLELARKLQHAGYVEDEIRTTLDELSERGWLSSQRFAENYVTQKQAKYGSQKMAYELRQKGVDESIVQQILTETKETELKRAIEVWRRKYNSPPSNNFEMAKQIRFLQGRGFTPNIIRQIFNMVFSENHAA